MNLLLKHPRSGPLGYRIEWPKDGKRFVPTPEGREYLPHIFARIVEGQPLRQVAYSSGMRGLKIRGKLSAVVTLAALVSVLGGCGGGGGKAADGPLSSGLSIHGPIPRGGICAPGGRAWAFGFQSFTNFGKTTVVLDRVVLLHPRNEHLVGSYAVPGAVLVGVGHWPPKYPGTPAGVGVPSAWKHRQPVHGFRLAPGKSFNMVLGVAASFG